MNSTSDTQAIPGHTLVGFLTGSLNDLPTVQWSADRPGQPVFNSADSPPGVPVATVAIDGARNDVMLAARIPVLKYPEIDNALENAVKRERYDLTADEALAQFRS